MYDIALSVNACIRSNTRADVAWLVSSHPDAKISDAIVFTPGGGKIGSVLGGVFDGHFTDVTSLKLSTGRLLEVNVGPLESSLINVPVGTILKFIVMPANTLEEELWPALLQRESIAIITYVKDREITKSEVFTTATILAADPEVAELFNKGVSTIADLGERIVTIYHPVTRLVIAGSGPIADAIEAGAKALGWHTSVDPRPEIFSGFTAALSPIDAAVIMGHDVESSSICLASALGSNAGYIGALGSLKMQQNRADWLAYRDITDISRVHGPAGVNIGAKTPAEIAVSVLAEVIAVLKGVVS